VEHWVVIHWFELSTLVLLGLNLWFLFSVLKALHQTSRWLEFLSLQWDQLTRSDKTDDTSVDSQTDISDHENDWASR
jgi:hypothetical protein